MNPKRWSRMFLAAAVFNFLIGGAIFFAPGWSYRLAYVGESPAGTLRFWGGFGLAVLLLGVGYWIVSRDLTRHRGIVWLGIFAKLFAGVALIWRWAAGIARPIVLLPVAVDGAFVALFILFLVIWPLQEHLHEHLKGRRDAPPGFLARCFFAAALGFVKVERRFDPFFRPFIDRLLREPLTRLVQALINLTRHRDKGLGLAEEKPLPDEAACLDSIVADMAAYMRANYKPGSFERAGNTKTHGIVRGEFIVRDDVPAELRHGVFAEPRTFRAWVRFAGPGPESPPDIEDVGVLSIGIKLMGVPGPKLLDDEQATQDFTGISTPVFTTPDVRENAKLQAAIRRGAPLSYFLDPFDSHYRDSLMQALWSRTQTSPLETGYWSCVPYLLGEGRAMQYSVQPRTWTRSRVPRLPFRPSDNYLRETMAATLARQDVELDFYVQVQTDPHRMPLENASVRWPVKLSRPVPVATLRLPRQKFDSPAQLAFAGNLSYNPWHSMPEHRPLGNQNRARRRLYQELSRLRQSMNDTPHREPTGDEVFE